MSYTRLNPRTSVQEHSNLYNYYIHLSLKYLVPILLFYTCLDHNSSYISSLKRL